MTTCQRTGCTAEATHHPQINVPAMGHPRDTHQPLHVVIGLSACEAHCQELKPSDFLADNGGQSLRPIFEIMARGKCAPDFDRAFVTCVRLDSPAAQVLKRGRDEAAADKA